MAPTASYLDEKHLRALDNYAYSSVDKSFVSRYIMRHWWTYSATFAPIWIAPNLITLLGFGCILLNVLTVCLVDPDLASPTPSWIYYTCALGLFLYQTMDNIDGKQARRTGTSSPLGELFDHGIDTLNCPLGALVQCSAFGFGHSKSTLLCILLPCWSMYLSTWEEYHTHTLYLGYFNGPVEGILIAVAAFILTAIKGVEYWETPLYKSNIPIITTIFEALLGENATLQEVSVVMALFLFLFTHLPFCLYNVYSHLTADTTYGSRLLTSPRRRAPLNAKPKAPVSEAFLQLFPLIAFSGFAALWLLNPSSIILAEQHMFIFTFVVCFLFGQLSTKIILAQLTAGEFPFSPTLLVPFMVGAILSNLGIFTLIPNFELTYLYCILLLSSIGYSTMAMNIISAFCKHLNINCLTIPQSKIEQLLLDEQDELDMAMKGRKRSPTDGWERGIRVGYEKEKETFGRRIASVLDSKNRDL